MDDAGGARRREVRVAPGDGGADGFGGVTFAAFFCDEGPSYFRNAAERWETALVVCEADFSDETAS